MQNYLKHSKKGAKTVFKIIIAALVLFAPIQTFAGCDYPNTYRELIEMFSDNASCAVMPYKMSQTGN